MNPIKNIRSYYGTTKLTLIELKNYLMLILTVPLIDISLQMNIYKLHNLPPVHTELQIQAQYELNGKYFATLLNTICMWHCQMKKMFDYILLQKGTHMSIQPGFISSRTN